MILASVLRFGLGSLFSPLLLDRRKLMPKLGSVFRPKFFRVFCDHYQR